MYWTLAQQKKLTKSTIHMFIFELAKRIFPLGNDQTGHSAQPRDGGWSNSGVLLPVQGSSCPVDSWGHLQSTLGVGCLDARKLHS